MYGARGSLLAIVVASVVLAFRSSKHKARFLVVFVVVSLMLIVMGSILGTVLVGESSDGFLSGSRTFALLANGDISNDAGRFPIWNTLWADFLENPLAIRGICSEYPLVGMYAHNFVIQLLHSFGLIIGGGCVIFIGYEAVSTLRMEPSADSDVATAYLMCFFPLLLWSGSIWSSVPFWTWLAVLYAIKNHAEKSAD